MGLGSQMYSTGCPTSTSSIPGVALGSGSGDRSFRRISPVAMLSYFLTAQTSPCGYLLGPRLRPGFRAYVAQAIRQHVRGGRLSEPKTAA